MGVEHLLTTLEREGNDRVAAIIEQAGSEAAALTAEADRRREATRRRELAEAKAAAAARIERAVVEERRRGQAQVLAARQAFLDRVLAMARARFPAALASRAYLQSLPLALERAIGYLGTRQGTIHVSPVLLDRVRGLVSEGSYRAVADAAVEAGVTVRAADGSVVIDDTLGARLRRQEQAIAIAVLRTNGRPR